MESQSMRSKKICVKDAKYTIEAYVINCGNDLNISICGGSEYHIGACSICMPDFLPVTYTCVNHRDNLISDVFAKDLAEHFRSKVVVSVGIHIDNATEAEIERLISNCNLLLRKIKNNCQK